MFYPDGTFNFVEELIELADEFCQEWVERRGPFESKLEGALILNFALCTIQYDLEVLLERLEKQSVFKGISPREVYERGEFGDPTPKGLDEKDIMEIVENYLHRN